MLLLSKIKYYSIQFPVKTSWINKAKILVTCLSPKSEALNYDFSLWSVMQYHVKLLEKAVKQ